MKKNKLNINDEIAPFNGILTNQYTDTELYTYLTFFRNKIGNKEDENIKFFIRLIEDEIVKRKKTQL